MFPTNQEGIMRNWTPSALIQASGSYWESCALHAAVHLDLFSLLEDSDLDIQIIARKLNCPVRGLDMLVTAMCSLNLLRRQGNLCCLTSFSRQYLCRRSPDYLGHILEHHRHLVSSWAHLDEAVLKAEPTRRRSSSETASVEERKSFLMGMYNMANTQAKQCVPYIDLAGKTKLLDVGGGTGAYAIHFCRQNPNLLATVFDLPTSQSFATQVIAQSGMKERIAFYAGDFTYDPLPNGFDVAWLSHILHGAGAAQSARIVTKAAQALEPGGLLLIQEFIVDNDRNGPVFPALFSLNMLVGTAKGQSFTERELEDFMLGAGLTDIRRLPLELPQGCGIMAGLRL